jgi:hypothetical protein
VGALRRLPDYTRGYRNYIGNCEKYVAEEINNFISSVVYFKKIVDENYYCR